MTAQGLADGERLVSTSQRLIAARPAGSLRTADFHQTPRIATESLLAVETFTGPIWEPACGLGAISSVLEEHGHDVVSTDLVERGYGTGRVDFLLEQHGLAPNRHHQSAVQVGRQVRTAGAPADDRQGRTVDATGMAGGTAASPRAVQHPSARTNLGLQPSPADDAPRGVRRTGIDQRRRSRMVRLRAWQRPSADYCRLAQVMSASDNRHQLATQRAPRRTESSCRLVEWKPWPFENPSLIGHCSIAFAGGWCVHRIPVFRKADGSLSIGTPDAADVDRDGRIKLKPDGKKSYWKVISFETTEARERWQRMILAALADAGVAAPEPGEATQ